MLELALEYARRGWYVFPCWPRTKKPMTRHGWQDATLDEAQIRAWWEKTPDANIAIATGPSRLVVVDIDHGLEPLDAELPGWLTRNGFTYTYTVRTGRRPEMGLQLYYILDSDTDNVKSLGGWELDGCSGDVRADGGYVMAAGSVHPSGERYTVFVSTYLVPRPSVVRTLERTRKDTPEDDGAPITANRNTTLTRIAGKLRNAGLGAAALEAALLQVNADRCQPPLEDEEVKRIAANAGKWELDPGEGVSVSIGTKQSPEIKDWREHYHTQEETENAPPVTFLIDKFLAKECITGLAAPAGQRKSLIALNIADACCTGQPLFGSFKVSNPPTRVIYLCPEMGLSSFADRVKKIGLLPYVGKTFFFRSMNMELLELAALRDEELQGALVIIDTAIRYLKGDESSSGDMREFAKMTMHLLGPNRAASVLILYHSGKGTKESPELTLENAIRGSSELGAALACCWTTRLQNPTEYYTSPSFLTCVKQRDFQPEGDFEVASKDGVDPRLTIKGSVGGVTLKSKFSGNRDGKDEAADSIIRAYPDATIPEVMELMKSAGCKRGKNWVSRRRRELLPAGAVVTE